MKYTITDVDGNHVARVLTYKEVEDLCKEQGYEILSNFDNQVVVEREEQDTPKGRYQAACKQASEESKREECTKHVNARITLRDGVPTIIGYALSDWYDGSTVKSYTNGKEH